MNWILCPTHNNLHLTRSAVKSFLAQDIPTKVLLIDNASTDGTPEWARSMYPQVVYIRRDPPLSVAQSWNRGLSLLFEGTPNQHVLVCNNDVELRPDTYRLLLEDGGGFVTGVGVDSKGQVDPGSTTQPKDKVDVKTLSRSPHPHFSCYLIHREVWEKVGKFDEGFKGAFCEDWDYHVRMHKMGVNPYCINIPFYHVGSATINSMGEKEREALCKQADANREYFKAKWGVAGGSPEYYALFNHPSSDAH